MTIRTFKHLLLAAKTSASEALGRSNVAKAKSAIAPQGKPAYLVIDIDIKDEERFEKEYVSKVILGCCRFQRHLVKVEDETGGGSWEREGNSAESSSLKRSSW